MFHSVKRYIALSVMVALLGAVPTFANSVNSASNKKMETVVIDVPNGKSLPAVRKLITRKANHKYQLTLKEGEKVSFKLSAERPADLKIVSDAGVREEKDGKFYQGALSGAGNYEIEISSDETALYTFEISAK